MARQLTYCSIANADGCRGVVIFEGMLDESTLIERIATSGLISLGDDDQVLALPCDENDPEATSTFEIMWANKNTLLTPDQARSLFDARSLGEWQDDPASDSIA